MHSFRRARGVCLAVFLACASAGAQTAPKISAPRAQTSTDVPYPPGAEGDATVVLELVIEKDGTVSGASVVEGEPPFAEHARNAASTWRFTPAQRDGRPVAARIRARVQFHRELETEPEATPFAAGASPPPRRPETANRTGPAIAAPPAAPAEITIVGVRREIGQTVLDKDEVRLMPGAFGDAFRAIEALPGVTPLVSGIPYYYVRGAPPNTAGYFIDGVRVPLLFHLGLAQSVIHPGLIERVDFFPSAAPARYGGFAGGIIAGNTRAPAVERRGELNLRLVDAGALLEAPFADQRATALVAGRYGYPGPILSLVDEVKLGYWDYQARATYRVGAESTLGVFAFGSHDYLATREGDADPEAGRDYVEQLVSDFHRVDLRYDRELPGGRLRVALTGGYDSMGAHPSYVVDHSVALRVELEQSLTGSVRYRGGVDGQLDRYRIRTVEQGPREAAVPYTAVPPPTNARVGVHSDFVWRAGPRVELVAGARFALFGSERHRAAGGGRERVLAPAIDPRIAARVTLADGFAWLSTLGLSHQYPSLRLGDVPGPLVSVPGFPFGVKQLQRAVQASQGVELALPGELVLTATGFFTRWTGLTDLSVSCYQETPGFDPDPMPGDPPPPYVCPDNAPMRGHAYGAELALRRPFTKKLSGWLSYTLSRTVQESRFVTPLGTEDVVTVPSEFDRTHVLNAVLGYDLGRRWHFGSRFVLYTGTPFSHLDGSIPVPPYRAYRGDAFYRVDVRLEKRWRLGEKGSIAFVIEGQNVTLQKEVTNLGQDCEARRLPDGGDANTCEPSEIGPLTIPSIGVEAFF